MQPVFLVSLLAAAWGARGEPPGAGRHDAAAQDKAGAVQGLQYFATGVSSLPAQQLFVYPGPVVGSHLLVPAQVGQPAAIPLPGYGTQPAQLAPVPAYGQQTSVLYGGAQPLHHGGGYTPQGGVLQAASTPSTPPATAYTTVPGVAYAASQPAAPTTPYGFQPPHALYQEGVRPLAPGFLFSGQQSSSSSAHDDRSLADVDLTYDSLGAPSTSHGEDYAPARRPPPMRAATYGPPRPLPRRPAAVAVPHYHPVHRGVVSPYYHYHLPHGAHRHAQATVVLGAPSHRQHSQQQLYRAQLAGYAPHHGYHLAGQAGPHEVAMMHDQSGYSTIVGTFYQRPGLQPLRYPPAHRVHRSDTNWPCGVRGEVSSVPLGETRAGEVYNGNSEEVVSAVVLVKQK
ncbi:uncharacterized protein LOC134533246 isoform X2 [Bacillus rossius redtenbacheri]|uniref:uncharacterized protein LOC134533246 isoform X2 n=1 Tax=Bacillus rossius redtenbacheri TaxID=93214 RepID=UPI002FDE6BB4